MLGRRRRFEDFHRKIFLPVSPCCSRTFYPLSHYLSSLRVWGQIQPRTKKSILSFKFQNRLWKVPSTRKVLKLKPNPDFLWDSFFFSSKTLNLQVKSQDLGNPSLEFIHSYIHSLILQLFIEHIKYTRHWGHRSEWNKVSSWRLHSVEWSWTISTSRINNKSGGSKCHRQERTERNKQGKSQRGYGCYFIYGCEGRKVSLVCENWSALKTVKEKLCRYVGSEQREHLHKCLGWKVAGAVWRARRRNEWITGWWGVTGQHQNFGIGRGSQ